MATVRVNPLQRLWLREIGIDKTWLRAPAPGDAAAVPVPAGSAMAPAVEPPVPPAPVAKLAPAMRPESPPARPAKAEPTVVEVAAPGHAGVEVARRVAGQDLAQLEREVFACTACGLCQGRKHSVFGEGARPARWLVVGEAPGEQEDRRGLPFVGRSGQLLDAMLASVGMSRERDVFIANVIKCRPPGNRNPKPEEIAACSPYLMRQIDLIEPDRILVLGRFAAQALLGTDATIGTLRGRRHTLKTGQGREIPVIVSYHPAYLLRSPSEKARAWQDLQLALREA
ncbi:uracil-DNA glycosylase [Bordetella genomosp. 12]|uniref:Type-4 uracil-DNA glycosylase n=1 Tax=Bordetella genomosp. 12 TaxID=463035 RepID=A0A261VM24_9BORD|nr:uracil-DNA glycosylase [Bordetella genomosp. 12]OZI75155.1 uracil-DNA glycosylase [Bordetella genomosp. 12]